VLIRLLLFAGLRERAGRDEFIFDDLPSGSTIEDVVARARQRIPGFDQVAFAVARNRALVATAEGRRAAVQEGDELALLPPVSGG